MFQRAFAYGEPTKATVVVYIDYGCGVGGQRKKPRGCALGHRWTPGQHQRRAHPRILPHVLHRSALTGSQTRTP